MIGEFIRSYVKSKPIFKTYFFTLSKLVEQAKIHSFSNFQVHTNLSYKKNYQNHINDKSRDYSALDDPLKRKFCFRKILKITTIKLYKIL